MLDKLNSVDFRTILDDYTLSDQEKMLVTGESFYSLNKEERNNTCRTDPDKIAGSGINDEQKVYFRHHYPDKIDKTRINYEQKRYFKHHDLDKIDKTRINYEQKRYFDNHDTNRDNSDQIKDEIFLFSENSQEAHLPDYKRHLRDSKLFLFNPFVSGLYSVNLLSRTGNYFPQIRVSYINKDSGEGYMPIYDSSIKDSHISDFYEINNKYAYVLEIGLVASNYTFPFGNKPLGKFI